MLIRLFGFWFVPAFFYRTTSSGTSTARRGMGWGGDKTLMLYMTGLFFSVL